MAAASWQETASAIGTLAAVAASVTVAIVEAVRAHKARRERDELLKAQQNAEHRRAASLVSAWVEETYVPSADGRAYWRVVIVHIANEGDQLVFQASVTIGAGGPTRTIGPLSVPNRIPVLPPRRELIWDITLPLLVHQNTEQPCAEVSFVDPAGREWVRRFDGTLEEITGQPATLVEIADEQAMIETARRSQRALQPDDRRARASERGAGRAVRPGRVRGDPGAGSPRLAEPLLS